jgi:DNA-directed RNA polymerase subunit D
MSEATTMIPAKKESNKGFQLDFEVRGVQPAFVNALRRIILNETPVVEIGEVEIHENNTLMPHEMLRHRTEMLPVNVRPTEDDILRTAKLTLLKEGEGEVFTSDFAISAGEGLRTDLLMKDRDIGEPLYFLKMKKDTKVHLTARLRKNMTGTHACTVSYKYHIDEEKVEEAKADFLAANPSMPDAAQVFDNFYIQRCYHKNEKGRPDWFDFTVESIGLLSAKEIVVLALRILKERVQQWSKLEDILHEAEEGVYTLTSAEGHTIGALVQTLLYESGLCDFASYDVPHPLKQVMHVRVRTTRSPQELLAYCATTVAEVCDALEKEL